MLAENRYNIKSRTFLEILAEEDCLRKQALKYPINSPAWNSVWNKLDRVLARKHNYEAAVLKNRQMGDCR